MTGASLLTAALATPLLGAVLAILAWNAPALRRAVSLAASATLLAVSLALLAAVISQGPVAIQAGAWPAPFGITLVADRLAAAMVAIAGLMAVAVDVHAGSDPDRRRLLRDPCHAPLFQGLLFGVVGAFLAGDIFNLYVWFEVMLVCSFGLLSIAPDRARIDGATTYVVLNLFGTTLFLVAVGLLYGATGSLNFADLARRLPALDNQGLVAALGLMLLAAFGLKGAVFPLFFWLPASYHTLPAATAAIFAALLTKVGVYALVRSFTLLFQHQSDLFAPIIAVVAAATMVTGVLGAAAHFDVRRILSFHIISQIGYMLMGLAIMTPLALAGSVLYIVHHIIVKANLFLIAGAMRRLGSDHDLARAGGLWRREPLLAILFLIPALSLAGVPPLSGFWGKFLVVKAGLDAAHMTLAAIALLVGLLTLYSMTKIWVHAFWQAAPADAPSWRADLPAGRAERAILFAPIAALACVTLAIGLWIEPFAAFAIAAGDELLSRDAYVAAVLGAPP
jgi:multicomponent Na+:H+ antiporter subunit D